MDAPGPEPVGAPLSIGRYEWAGGDAAPRFHFSVELSGGGRVWESSFELPEGALLRWPGRG